MTAAQHWQFVAAAYAVTGLGLFGLLATTFAAMRRAERRADGERTAGPGR